MNNYWHTNYRAYQDGITTFRYSIRPHGPLSLAEAQRFGMEQSQPLIVIPARDRKSADAPRPKIDSKDVFLTAFKPADDGKGYVLRLFAGAGRDVDVLLGWDGKAPAAVYRSDTLESRGGAKVDGPVHLAAWQVLTLRAE
jgi:alpha-mannosidase